MGKKMKLPFFSKTPTPMKDSLWPWPAYCQQPKTLSFRDNSNNIFFNTINSSSSTIKETHGQPCLIVDPLESMIKGLRSERLFFEPVETSSFLQEANNKKGDSGSIFPFKESEALLIDSEDPYLDFKKSMEEMVDAHGMKNSWEELKDLLRCYLRMNKKSNHVYILRAFVDLLVDAPLASTITCSNNGCPCSFYSSVSSPLSLYTSSFSCSASSSTSSYECSSSNHRPRPVSTLVLEAEEVDIISPCLCSLQAHVEME